jgi:hypothetical protein
MSTVRDDDEAARADEGDVELVESWFDRPRPLTSRPPPPDPLGDETADAWFR